MIESARNPRVKLARRLLASRSMRDREWAFVVEGEDLLLSALDHGLAVECVIVDSDRTTSDDLTPIAAQAEVLDCRAEILAELSTLGHPPRMLAIVKRPRVIEVPYADGVRVVLDGIQDPGNVGTIIRTAGAFGVVAVGLTEGTADPYGPKALRAGMGVTFALPLVPVVPNDPFPSRGPLVVLDADGEVALHDLPSWLSERGAQGSVIVVGSERHGPSDAALQNADVTVRIPHLRAGVESLNAGIAASIALYELTRG